MSTSQDRPAYHHGDLRRALLDAAVDLLEQEPPADFTLRELARRAGVSHAAPYKHFVDKQALLDELATAGFERLSATLASAATQHPTDPLQQLAATGRAYVAFAQEHPAHFRIMFGPGRDPSAPPPALAGAAQAAYQSLVDIVARAVDAGQIPAEHRDTAPLAAWSLVHGLASLAIDRRLRAGLAVAPAANAITQLFVNGLRAPPA